MNALIVIANEAPVGTLTVEGGQWKFIYASDWTAYALSPRLPIAGWEFQDTANFRAVEWFFENLLPEGRLRDLIALRDSIHRPSAISCRRKPCPSSSSEKHSSPRRSSPGRR